MDRKNIVMDSQILNGVQTCAYKTDLTFNQDLQPVIKGEALEEGDLLHQMFEFYNNRIKEFGAELLYDNEKFNHLLEEAVTHGEKVSVSLGLHSQEIDAVIYQFQEYCKFTRMDGVRVIEAERPFIIELYKDDRLGIYYTGKIDRFTDTPNFGMVPRDYKKAAQARRPLNTSNQFQGYAYATWPANASIHYVIVDKVGFQKTLPPEERFKSYPIPYTRDMMEAWKNNTIWWGKMYAFFLENDTWPKNFTSCDKYGNCIFSEVCESGTEEGRIHKLNTMFQKGDKWDPTKPLKLGKEVLRIK